MGDSCQVGVPADLLARLPRNLFRMHGAGTGRNFSELEGAAVLAARLGSLCRGYSGMRAHVLQAMALGPLFLPLYLLAGGISVRNRFERAADRYAMTGKGWWPW